MSAILSAVPRTAAAARTARSVAVRVQQAMLPDRSNACSFANCSLACSFLHRQAARWMASGRLEDVKITPAPENVSI